MIICDCCKQKITDKPIDVYPPEPGEDWCVVCSTESLKITRRIQEHYKHLMQTDIKTALKELKKERSNLFTAEGDRDGSTGN